ncbi:MAG TPA: YfiR family protein [Patescibacteria group bacterium]|nr:YfiR family protein [Patescibacteria group bacterium]
MLLCLLVTVGGVDGLFPDRTYAELSPLEYQVKAAFLYQFSKFVEWPAQAFRTSQYTICIGVVDGGPMAGALQSIEGQESKGRRVVVKQFKTPENLEFCHILYISPALASRLAEILDQLNGTSTLTVSDISGFARRGGMINLITVDDKIQFEINVDAAERANLQISSHLLRLARIVSGKR